MSAGDDLNMRTLILQKSTELFLSEGYNNTTIRQIAESVHVGRGHLYYYFKKKEDILLHLFTNMLRNIQKLLTNMLGSEMNFYFKISLAVYVYIHVLTQNKNIFRIYIEASKVDSLRREYIQIMDMFIQDISASANYEIDKKGLYLNSVVSVSAEFELLSQFNDGIDLLSLETIISTVIKTRLLLLNASPYIVEELITETSKEYSRLKKLGTFDNMSEILIKVN
jgi:AcrR family transcriptional regulator